MTKDGTMTTNDMTRYDVTLTLSVPTDSYMADIQTLEDEITSWLGDLNITVEAIAIQKRDPGKG